MAHFERPAIQEKIDVVVTQGAAMELRDGVVELASDVGDGLRRIAFSEKGFEDLADLAGVDDAETSLQDEVVDGLVGALLVGAGGGTANDRGAGRVHAEVPPYLC